MQSFEFPEPDKEAELSALVGRTAELDFVAQTVNELGLDGTEEQVQIAGLHELAIRCEGLARRIGMHAIAEGRMSQVQLSKLLNVHQLTVHRWVKAAQEQQNSQEQQAE